VNFASSRATVSFPTPGNHEGKMSSQISNTTQLSETPNDELTGGGDYIQLRILQQVEKEAISRSGQRFVGAPCDKPLHRDLRYYCAPKGNSADRSQTGNEM